MAKTVCYAVASSLQLLGRIHCRRELYGKLFQYVIDESTARSMAWQPFEVQVRSCACAPSYVVRHTLDQTRCSPLIFMHLSLQVDLTDGSHALASVMRALRLPVLTQSRGIRDYIRQA